MGVLPLVFKEGEDKETFQLKGSEVFQITGIEDMKPRKILKISAERENGEKVTFDAISRLDTDIDVDYFENGGILPYVLRKFL
jgi:aconitate hydratase